MSVVTPLYPTTQTTTRRVSSATRLTQNLSLQGTDEPECYDGSVFLKGGDSENEA